MRQPNGDLRKVENNAFAFPLVSRLKTVMNPSTSCDINCNIQPQLDGERFHSSYNSRVEELGRNVDALIQEILCEEEADSPNIVTNSVSTIECHSSYLTIKTAETNMVYNTTNSKKLETNFSTSIEKKTPAVETKSKPAFLKMFCDVIERKEDTIVYPQNMITKACMTAVNNIHLQDSKSKQILVRDCDTIFEKDVDLEQSKNLAANLNELMEKNNVQFISADDSDTFIISLNSSIDTEQLSNFLDIGVQEVHFGTIQDVDKNVLQSVNLGESLSSDNRSNSNQSKAKAAEVVNAIHSKIYTCEECKRIFTKKDNFKSHLGTHDPSLSVHKCKICKKQFSWKSTLNKHIQRYHTPFVQTTYKCDMCEKVYKANWLLRNHVKRDHEKDYQFACDVDGCNKSFFKQFDWTYHRRIHLGERPYECGLCKSRFSHASHRTRHQRTGACSNHKSLVCPLCKHVFRRSAAIATHIQFLATIDVQVEKQWGHNINLGCIAKRKQGLDSIAAYTKKAYNKCVTRQKNFLSDIDEVIKDAS